MSHYPSQGSTGQKQEESILFLTGPFGVIDISRGPVTQLGCPRSYYRDELEFEGRPFAMFLEETTVQPQVSGDRLVFVTQVHKANVLCLNELPEFNNYNTFDRYRDGLLQVVMTATGGTVTYDEAATTFEMATPP